MPKFAPKVLDGTRGPRSERIDDIRAEQEQDAAQGMREMPKVDGTVYLSAFPGYMVQIDAEPDHTDPVTGRKTIGRPTKALFTEGRYVNNARDKVKRQYIDKVLQSNSRFGRPGSGADYWLAEDAIRMTLAAAKASATATLRQLARENPAELEKLLGELKQGSETDHAMPQAQA